MDKRHSQQVEECQRLYDLLRLDTVETPAETLNRRGVMEILEDCRLAAEQGNLEDVRRLVARGREALGMPLPESFGQPKPPKSLSSNAKMVIMFLVVCLLILVLWCLTSGIGPTST